MSANWNSQFIFAIGVAVALGNVLALGVHVFTWWLRRRKWPRLVMAILGGAALLMFLGGIGFLSYVFIGFNYAGGDAVPSPPGNAALRAMLDFLKITGMICVVVGLVGAAQMRQIPARWIVACLCFCFELAFALLPFSAVRIFQVSSWFPRAYSLPQGEVLANVFSVVFIFSLFALAFFRPIFLVVLKYFRRCGKPETHF